MATNSIFTFAIFLICIVLVHSGKIMPGTNYEVDEDDVITYLKLGDICKKEVQNSNQKTGICRATLTCSKNPETNLHVCDCESIGPYKYTAMKDGTCKIIAGGRCFATKNCVPNSTCVGGKCVCEDGAHCVTKRVHASPRVQSRSSMHRPRKSHRMYYPQY